MMAAEYFKERLAAEGYGYKSVEYCMIQREDTYYRCQWNELLYFIRKEDDTINISDQLVIMLTDGTWFEMRFTSDDMSPELVHCEKPRPTGHVSPMMSSHVLPWNRVS